MLEDGGKTKPLEVGDVVKYHCTYTEEKHECQGCRYENKEGIIERISLHEKDNGEKYRLYTVKINCCSSCYFTRRELTHIGFAEGVK
ncbi:hypothetical protein [Methanococcus maripaludis]|uniref:Uncharacterized protein n=1 Tax=Methanococcus maripaludis TaxID=39152 RepID=A0A8T3W808_METMI|nr:hypothetical protein [Methanococcus maripaludis]MBG0769669.1 hypothetical protein [Methanococcus maripaludis]